MNAKLVRATVLVLTILLFFSCGLLGPKSIAPTVSNLQLSPFSDGVVVQFEASGEGNLYPQLTYGPVDGAEKQFAGTVNPDRTLVRDVIPGTTYRFTVQVMDDQARFSVPVSEEILVTTEAVNVSASVYSDGFTLFWEPPAGGKQTGYQIQYGLSKVDENIVTLDAAATTFDSGSIPASTDVGLKYRLITLYENDNSSPGYDGFVIPSGVDMFSLTQLTMGRMYYPSSAADDMVQATVGADIPFSSLSPKVSLDHHPILQSVVAIGNRFAYYQGEDANGDPAVYFLNPSAGADVRVPGFDHLPIQGLAVAPCGCLYYMYEGFVYEKMGFEPSGTGANDVPVPGQSVPSSIPSFIVEGGHMTYFAGGMFHRVEISTGKETSDVNPVAAGSSPAALFLANRTGRYLYLEDGTNDLYDISYDPASVFLVAAATEPDQTILQHFWYLE